jgi:hypothetical protein
VSQVLDALGTYEALAAQVMYLDAGAGSRPAGQVPADESALFGKATDLMQQSVLLRQKIATDLPEAVRFDTSPALADSDGAFNAYATAEQSVIDINSGAFDSRITAGLDEMAPWPWIPAGGAVLVVVLLVGGIRPRLAEYR